MMMMSAPRLGCWPRVEQLAENLGSFSLRFHVGKKSQHRERGASIVFFFSILIREKKILFDDDSSSFFKSFELLDSSSLPGNLLV